MNTTRCVKLSLLAAFLLMGAGRPALTARMRGTFQATRSTSQTPVPAERPPLFFREDWKETPAVTPVSQSDVSNADLLIGLYGAGRGKIRKSHHDHPADDPFYVWSGLSEGNWAITLRKKDSYVDLSGAAKLRWRTKQSGLRRLHVLLKLDGGMWLVSDQGVGPMSDWEESEWAFADFRWHAININTVVETKSVDSPDLRKVDEIGWTDLMIGGGTPASSRVDWIEVYGWPAKRH